MQLNGEVSQQGWNQSPPPGWGPTDPSLPRAVLVDRSHLAELLIGPPFTFKSDQSTSGLAAPPRIRTSYLDKNLNHKNTTEITVISFQDLLGICT